jgi:hypothetical protein
MQENTGYRTLLAGEALATNRLVKLKSATATVPPEVVYADSDEAFIGSTEYAVALGDPVTIRLKNCSGTVELVASEAAAIGASLYTANDGKVADTNPGDAGTARAIALEASTADGDLIECLIL